MSSQSMTHSRDSEILGVSPLRADLNDSNANERDQLLSDSKSADPPRKRRRGGKIYSGCGTCRVRKIKCDERRPKCDNCEKSRHYECDGYDGPSNLNSVLPSMINSAPDWTGLMSVAADSRFWGAFPDLPPDNSNEELLLSWDDLDESLSRLTEPHPPGPGLATEYADTDQREHDDSTRQLAEQSMPTPVTVHSIGPVDMSNATRRLLHHYRTHVCQLMMPTFAPAQNPWLRLYLPLALQEPRTMPCQVLLHAIFSVAAFNRAQLSSSADKAIYQKQGREHGEKSGALLKTILDSHDSSAEISYDKAAKQTLMAAALTLSTSEVFSGACQGCGYEYLQLCKRVIQVTGGLSWWVSDPSCVTLFQIFRCLRIVASTSGWSNPSDTLVNEGDQEATYPVTEILTPLSNVGEDCRPISAQPVSTGDYTLDITFGISMKTLRYLNKISEFSQIKSRLAPDEPWPEGKVRSLLNVEAELFDSLEDPDFFPSYPTHHSQSQGGMPSYVADVIRDNHVWAFHYSTAIFFRRALCDSSSDINPSISRNQKVKRPTGQYLVSKAFEHLENIDTLSRHFAVANTLWPGFIAAVEAVDTNLRHRALIWMGRAKRHGIGNITKATSLVMEVWRRVDRQFVNLEHSDMMETELGHVDWREVMREKKWYIMLT